MSSLFTPAVALMNRLSYPRKFILLALIAVVAFAIVAYNLYAFLEERVSVSQRELEGIALIEPVSRTVQVMQRHRGMSAMLLGGNESVRNSRAAKEVETIEALRAMGARLPPDLASGEDWLSIKRNWEHLQKEGLNWTVEKNFTAHSRLIEQLLVFEVDIADQYALTLDPQLDTYYLLDTAVNKLPDVIEHLGQIRAYGVGLLTEKQINKPERIYLLNTIGKLEDALFPLRINLEKTGRHNPAIQDSLSTTLGDVDGSVRQITGLVTTDILTERFATPPDRFFASATQEIDRAYVQMYETLLPMADALIRARIARDKNVLYASIGIAILLLLVMIYFAIGIYHSIIDNIQSLACSARAFANGDMHSRINLDTRDELGQIGGSFNEMADGFNAILAAHKQAENDMQKSEAKFRTLFESSSDGIMLLDEKHFFDCNDAALRMFGCATRDELINKHPSQFSPPTQPGGRDSVSLANEQVATAFRNGSHWFEWLHRRLDGTEFPAGVLLTSMKLDGRKILQATVRDISFRKKAEDELRQSNAELKAINQRLEEAHNQLLQSEKMASIGQLAAGVAHEINNPIGYVYSNLGTLEKYVQDTFGMIDLYEEAEDAIGDSGVRSRLQAAKDKLDIGFLREDLRALMNESKDGITRVKKIVQSLKDFSHVDASDEWHFADLHNGLDSTLNIVNNEIKYKASVVREYGDLPEVECLSSQLNQVFMNLLVNAAHAIEERGTITIRTGRQGDEVWVEVADTGKGIAPEHLKKIFDPFFTTKPIGKGTGLGLSLSYGIIQKHHGRIEVESAPGKGTTFRVSLPVKQPEETRQP